MSGVFGEEILAEKLSQLNNTQQCIQSILRYSSKLDSDRFFKFLLRLSCFFMLSYIFIIISFN
jgi:hypothetical protein